MPNFAISSRLPMRFPGDFQLAPNSGHRPTTAEQSYLDAVNAAVDRTAADAAADITARYPEQLLLGRQAQRQRSVSDLEADARVFAAGHNTAGDQTRLTAIVDGYVSKIPKFGTKDASPPRFDGDFELVLVEGYNPTLEHKVFLDHVQEAVDELAADKPRDLTGNFSQSVISFRENQRRTAASNLRNHVAVFWTVDTPAHTATDNVVITRGRYLALRDRLERRLFNVTLTSEKKAEDETSKSNLTINLLGGLPSPQKKPS
jgi:hypothetical protein